MSSHFRADSRSVLDRIYEASGHSNSIYRPTSSSSGRSHAPSAFHPPPSSSGRSRYAASTVSPHDSISVAPPPGHYAPSAHSTRSMASGYSHRDSGVRGGGALPPHSMASGYSHQARSSSGESGTPQKLIRELALGAGSSRAASQALVDFKANSSSGGTMITPSRSYHGDGGRHSSYHRQPSGGNGRDAESMTVTLTDTPRGRELAINIRNKGGR
jgi:hypothetical protein